MVGGSTKKRECIDNHKMLQSDPEHIKTSYITKLNCNSHFVIDSYVTF